MASRAGKKPGVCGVLEANEKDFSRRREPKAAGEPSKMKNENWALSLTAWRSPTTLTREISMETKGPQALLKWVSNQHVRYLS